MRAAITVKINLKLVAVAVVVAALVVAVIVLPVKDWLVDALEWTQGLGVWGPVFVAVFYVVACVLFLPGSVLTLGAGFLFKVVRGTVTVSIGSTLGACAAFIVGRTIARRWIAQKVAAKEKFAAIDDAVGRQGFKIVFLTRLSPVFPFNLLNYAFGLTKVSFWKYALASWIGMLPGTVMYIYFGAGLRSLTDVAAGKVEKGAAGQVFFWFGMAATIVVTVFVTRVARKALKQAVPRSPAQEGRHTQSNEQTL
ncbi:MAG: TVP38/TMEM64 family protein [Planctomycetota bacterium]|jgi:uncharacterized membrane protein YdjX (TVP38/TMEM64 family)